MTNKETTILVQGSQRAFGIVRELKFSSDVDRPATAKAIEGAILKATELVGSADELPSRKEATKLFKEISRSALALKDSLSNSACSFLIRSDVKGFAGEDLDSLIQKLNAISDIATHRTKIIGIGGGRHTFYDEMGFPTPEAFIATFVIRLLTWLTNEKPGRENKVALELCSRIWREVEVALQKAKCPSADDFGAKWMRHLREAGEIMKDLEKPAIVHQVKIADLLNGFPSLPDLEPALPFMCVEKDLTTLVPEDEHRSVLAFRHANLMAHEILVTAGL